jgi:hypothetical protein
MSKHEKISRRTWLKGVALLSAAAGVSLMLASTPAEAKASKAAVHYQDFPSGSRMCRTCKFFIWGGRSGSQMMGCPMGGGMMGRGMMGGGACQLVEGRISPRLLRPICSSLTCRAKFLPLTAGFTGICARRTFCQTPSLETLHLRGTFSVKAY